MKQATVDSRENTRENTALEKQGARCADPVGSRGRMGSIQGSEVGKRQLLTERLDQFPLNWSTGSSEEEGSEGSGEGKDCGKK